METPGEKSTTKVPQTRLLSSTALEPRDELDERMEACFNILQGVTAGLGEKEANDALSTFSLKATVHHDEIQIGLLYGVLTEADEASKHYHNMILHSRDTLNVVLCKVIQLVRDKWAKLMDVPKTQMVWFCREIIRNGLPYAESVAMDMVKLIAGGDVSDRNIWLCSSMLDIFEENRSWVEKTPGMLPMVVYTFLRTIVDHHGEKLGELRKREVAFCLSLLREKWMECVTAIGRDLARLLQNVARIPEFEKLWYDIMLNPTSLSPQFSGMLHIMQTRSSRRFLGSRLTHEMEAKILFLLSKVKFGAHKRYQEWFQKTYLSTPESQSLRCDLIRYICAVFHPTNELLSSDVIPRWAVIGWLMTTCTSNVTASEVKLALFFDWLFFDESKDNIMNIEPGILVMFHSIPQHLPITATLLDFLCRIMKHFCPMLVDQCQQGVYNSLNHILEKRVIKSLAPLFDNNKLDKELRTLIQENFREFCSPEVIKEEVNVVEMDNGHIGYENNIAEEAEFSDDEDSLPLGQLKTGTGSDLSWSTRRRMLVVTEEEFQAQMENLEMELTAPMQELADENKDQAAKCEQTQGLVQAIIQFADFDDNTMACLGTCLYYILQDQFRSPLFPQEVDDETIEESIGKPIFVMFRFVSEIPEEDPKRQPLLQVLGEVLSKQPAVGYYLLYFLKVSKMGDEKMATYKDFCKSLDKDLSTCLLDDLTMCREDDVRLFTYLMPEVYTHFPNIAVGNADLLHLLVSSIDGTQLQDLICQILQGHLVMFKNKETFLSVLNKSLEWETIEQYFLWQLIAAHNIPAEHILPILPKLEYTAHAEALTSILVLLKQESPSPDLLRLILCRECRKTDLFTVSILKFWAQEQEDRLAELINSQLTKLNGGQSKKRKGGSSGSKKESPSVDQVLAHLDHMRQVCRNISFLNNETVQHALQHVQQSASDALKSKYGDLLALAEDIEDMKTTRVLRGRKASSAHFSQKPSRNRKAAQDSSDSNSESSDEDEPKGKKRKRMEVADDNSD